MSDTWEISLLQRQWFHQMVPGNLYYVERKLDWEFEHGYIDIAEFTIERDKPSPVGIYMYHYNRWGVDNEPTLVFYLDSEIYEFTPISRIFRDFNTGLEVKHEYTDYR